MPGAPRRFPAVAERGLLPQEQLALDRARSRVAGLAKGRVLELGGGRGLQLPRYRSDRVTGVDVVGVDLVTLPLLRRQLDRAHVPTRLIDAALEDLDEGSYDTVVSVFALCAVPSLPATLASVKRVLADDGRLVFLEPVPPRGLAALLTRVAPAPVPPALGWDPRRDVPAALWRAGFTITDIERFTMPTLRPSVRACALGTARRALPRPGGAR